MVTAGQFNLLRYCTYPSFPLSRKSFTPLPHFVLLAFVRENRYHSLGSYFSFYDRMRQMENKRRWFSKLFDHNRRGRTDIRIHNGFLVRGAPNGVEQRSRDCPA
ncbi:hypothetical protein AVEN_204769-1 [Araneus ventricosus]|uniref:Uncharacterized protein n=1 Tax=Araneus ventricosus TaxID=182803 RepID=A0A4Y2FVT6_ARAVE|nr:hypothetical protein AVEN_204769-1 [Araneus ventricosus]